MLTLAVEEDIIEIISLNPMYSQKGGFEKERNFYCSFIVDCVVCAIKRWILDKNCIEPKKFLELIHASVTGMAIKVYNETKIED